MKISIHQLEMQRDGQNKISLENITCDSNTMEGISQMNAVRNHSKKSGALIKAADNDTGDESSTTDNNRPF